MFDHPRGRWVNRFYQALMDVMPNEVASQLDRAQDWMEQPDFPVHGSSLTLPIVLRVNLEVGGPVPTRPLPLMSQCGAAALAGPIRPACWPIQAQSPETWASLLWRPHSDVPIVMSLLSLLRGALDTAINHPVSSFFSLVIGELGCNRQEHQAATDPITFSHTQSTFSIQAPGTGPACAILTTGYAWAVHSEPGWANIPQSAFHQNL